MRNELRELLPVWAVAVLLPVPMTTFWLEGSGRAFAYAYLFLGMAIVTAESFGRSLRAGEQHQSWRAKLGALVIAATGAVGAFSTFAWAITGVVDATVIVLAVLAVLPAVCCVPYLTLLTRQPYTAVLFTVLLLALVKMLGCLVVLVGFGSDAEARGELSLPFEHPNFLVMFCIVGGLVCSTVLFGLGRRAFARV
jgi:hypothetical protein